MKQPFAFLFGAVLVMFLLDRFLPFVLQPDYIYPLDSEAGKRRKFFEGKQ